MEEKIKSKFPMEFNKCPICGCLDTTCRLAYKQEVVDKGKGPEAFASSEKRPVPLLDPRSAMLSVPALLEHYDTCARCGMRYCTKAEIVPMTIGVGQQPGMKPFNFPQGDPRHS